jgi:hypothetical protein
MDRIRLRRSSRRTACHDGRHRPPGLLLMIYRLAYESLAERLRAGAADRLGRRALRAGRPGPVLLRRRRLRATRASGTRASPPARSPVTGQTVNVIIFIASRADRAAVPVLRAHALRQGAARHRREPRGRAPDGHRHQQAGRLAFTLAALIGALSRPADRADDDDLLRQRLPDRPEGLRGRRHRRPRRAIRWRCRRAGWSACWKASARSGPAPSRK